VNRQRNAFTAQKTANTSSSNKFSRKENIKGKIRVLTLKNTAHCQTVRLDYDGFVRCNADLITSVMKNYEKWSLDSLKVAYVPTVSKMASGSVAFAPDFDPLDNPVDEVDQLSYSDYFRSSSISEPFAVDISVPYKRKDPCDMLYVSPMSEPRVCSAGFLNFLVESDVIADATVGYVELSYNISLYLKTPVTNNTADGAGDRYLTLTTAAGVDQPLVCDGHVMDRDKQDLKITTGSNMTAGTILSYLIEYMSTSAKLYDYAGNLIRAGSRVFIKAAGAYISGGTLASIYASTPVIGWIATDPLFKNLITWDQGADTVSGMSLIEGNVVSAI
jgi:hypothetical protein